ncbi:hypothetical protein ACN28S_67845 [Cystobacter fuscus]
MRVAMIVVNLGDGTNIERHSPVRVPLSGKVAISAGYCHSLALKGDGTVWKHGVQINQQGRLGWRWRRSKSALFKSLGSRGYGQWLRVSHIPWRLMRSYFVWA